MILSTTWCYEVSVAVVVVVVVVNVVYIYVYNYTHCQCIVSSHCSGDVLKSTVHRVQLSRHT